MQICPSCELRYPTGHTHCDRDGSTLINDPTRPDSFSVDISMSRLSPTPDPTKAESPSGRRLGPQRTSPDNATRRSVGTRVSVGTPPPMPDEDEGERPSAKGAARAAAEARCGEVLGSYRLQSVLGFGGMGAVYSAEHIRLGRKVALKLLHPQFAARREAVVRFFQEAQAVNRIRHKNIVDVTDLVELEDGTSFIIMELLEGESLGARLRSIGLLGTGPTISVLIQICDALEAAHGVDIVHRDLKPDNIFLTTTDEGQLLVKLLDFGVAKLVGQDAEISVHTAAGSVVGTPAFMSPEQAGALQIDRRSDLYSLGAIMYQLFTGQHVFRGKSFGEYVRMHLNDEPTPARQTPGGINMDPELETIVMRCLTKSPNARFQSAASLRSALADYFELHAARVGGFVEGGSGIYHLSGVHERPPDDIYATPPATILPLGGEVTYLATPRRPPIFLVTAVVAVVAIIVVVSVTVSGRSGEKKSAAAVTVDAGIKVATLPSATGPLSIRIESNVLAHVFASGENKARCGTPCNIAIDRSDGGPRYRYFEVKADGHGDGVIEVDLEDPRPLYTAELLALAEPPADPIEDATGDARDSKGQASSAGKGKGAGSGKGSSGAGKGTGAASGAGVGSGSSSGAGKGSGAVPADKTLDPFGTRKKNP